MIFFWSGNTFQAFYFFNNWCLWCRAMMFMTGRIPRIPSILPIPRPLPLFSLLLLLLPHPPPFRRPYPTHLLHSPTPPSFHPLGPRHPRHLEPAHLPPSLPRLLTVPHHLASFPNPTRPPPHLLFTANLSPRHAPILPHSTTLPLHPHLPSYSTRHRPTAHLHTSQHPTSHPTPHPFNPQPPITAIILADPPIASICLATNLTTSNPVTSPPMHCSTL